MKTCDVKTKLFLLLLEIVIQIKKLPNEVEDKSNIFQKIPALVTLFCPVTINGSADTPHFLFLLYVELYALLKH